MPHVTDHANLTVVVGPESGRVFAIDRAEIVIGRGTEAHLVLDDPGVSRRHARVLRNADVAFVVEDLGSTNGTFVSGRRVTRETLTSGDRIQFGPNLVLRFALTDELEERMQRRLFESSTRDGLTGAHNRKHFEERLTAEVAYARRHGTAVAVLIVDVDSFKQVNDSHGHLAGDELLRSLVSALALSIRQEEILARYGGDEFVVLARSITAFDAVRLAERLREAAAGVRVPCKAGRVGTTVSVGVALLSEVAGPAADLVKLADARLYRAKKEGRNRVCAA
jgi:diguanylate cyclase (GGDEF)-like protein